MKPYQLWLVQSSVYVDLGCSMRGLFLSFFFFYHLFSLRSNSSSVLTKSSCNSCSSGHGVANLGRAAFTTHKHEQQIQFDSTWCWGEPDFSRLKFSGVGVSSSQQTIQQQSKDCVRWVKTWIKQPVKFLSRPQRPVGKTSVLPLFLCLFQSFPLSSPHGSDGFLSSQAEWAFVVRFLGVFFFGLFYVVGVL